LVSSIDGNPATEGTGDELSDTARFSDKTVITLDGRTGACHQATIGIRRELGSGSAGGDFETRVESAPRGRPTGFELATFDTVIDAVETLILGNESREIVTLRDFS
jgi:hypothetical protein